MRQYLSRRDILGQSLHRSPIQQTTSIWKVVKTTSGLKPKSVVRQNFSHF